MKSMGNWTDLLDQTNDEHMNVVLIKSVSQPMHKYKRPIDDKHYNSNIAGQ